MGQFEDPDSYHYYDDDIFAPLYPFGYGLSYTSFVISNVQVAHKELSVGKDNKVTLTVTNTGDCTGSTVVQCYIRDPQAQISRPVKELVDFEKVFLKPQESQGIEFIISSDQMGYYTSDGQFNLDEGEIQFGVGFDSSLELSDSFFVNPKH